jgi:membrane associated rhomboid family serine protease
MRVARAFPWCSVAIAATNVASFCVEIARHAIARPDLLLALGALPDDGSIGAAWWRLVTYGWLHWDGVHLGLNMALLLATGPYLERRLGRGTFVTLYLTAVVVSGAAILMLHALAPAAGVSVGASGGMFGLLGRATGPIDGKRAPRWALGLTAGGLVYSFLPGVSMAGHVAGLAVGLLFAVYRRGEGSSVLMKR